MILLLAALVFLTGDSFQEALGWGEMNRKRFGYIFSARSTKVSSMPVSSSSALSKVSQNFAASSSYWGQRQSLLVWMEIWTQIWCETWLEIRLKVEDADLVRDLVRDSVGGGLHLQPKL